MRQPRVLQCVAVCCSVYFKSQAHYSLNTQIWAVSWLFRICTMCATATRVAVCCSVLQCVLQKSSTIIIQYTKFEQRADFLESVLCTQQACVRLSSLWVSHVLLCVAVFCSVLQCFAVFCRVLDSHRPEIFTRVAVCCSVLQCVAVCCSVLWFSLVFRLDRPHILRLQHTATLSSPWNIHTTSL